jgi:hypothetical protein
VLKSLIDFLSSDNVRIPGPINEDIVSGKSLLRAIEAGNLVIMQELPDAGEGEPEEAASD